MDPLTEKHLIELSLHLASKREVILRTWRARAEADPVQTTVSVLTRAQFDDHIPQLLDAFEEKLRSPPGDRRAAAAERAETLEEVKHGLQRWQQGYHLKELLHEWGHLHVCLADEVRMFAASRPDISSDALSTAFRALIDLGSEGVNESVSQYDRLQQAEAAGRADDLQGALKNLEEMQRRRSALIREAVHDLRTNVQSVSTAAEILAAENMAAHERGEFATMMQQGLEGVSAMIEELMTLSRLEAGQERRTIDTFDAGRLVWDLCSTNRALAKDRKLFLKFEGPESIEVEGDAAKVRRILQNLIFNALKYTNEGGITVGWGMDHQYWWIIVKDTGPGLMAGPSAPIVAGMKEATASARESDPTVTPSPAQDQVAPAVPGSQRSGEGIGLSIVKRLCDLLDARLELVSSAKSGTTFRIVFPRRYGVSQSPA